MLGKHDRLGGIRGAAFISAAFILSVFFAVAVLSATRVSAQTPTRVEGRLVNGTRDAPANSIAAVPVTLFQITAAGPVTRSMDTDADGVFSFANVITNANSIFTRVNYKGVLYYSDIQPADIAGMQPITLTVYETQTLPADYAIDRAHFVLDVGPRRLDGLVLLQVTNPSDRAFYVPLPVPSGAVNVQFEDVREQTRIVKQEDGSMLYPVLPTTSQILYTLSLPTEPPTYELKLPIRSNITALNLLVSQAGGVQLSGGGLVPGSGFTSQNGQTYNVASTGPQGTGATFTALVSNLPGADNTRPLQNVVLVAGGAGALLLLLYPFVQRRRAVAPVSAPSDRMDLLQAIAQLDDAFEAGELEEDEYRAQRASLKAELLKSKVQS